MDKRKVISVVVLLFILSLLIYKLNINRINNNKEVDKVRVIDTKEDNQNNMFAFMIQGVDGKYTQSNNNTWPGEGYKLNTDNTKCMDNNGAEVKNGIKYNAKNNLITVTSGNTSYCYLYFDIKPDGGGDQILEKLPADSGLSTSTLGDMRRYQGTSAKNYICINATGNKCNSGSDEMYRIIGIVTDGDEEGEIKVIKETKYGNNYAWNTEYQLWKCGGDICSWPNSDLSKTLNSTFLESLPSKVQNAIVAREWYYGNILTTYVDEKEAPTIYQIETGQINTQYYDESNSLVTTKKWQKSSTKTKIGLMYLHDYYWQSPQPSCYNSSSNAAKCRDNGWMHLNQNGDTSYRWEWTMSRVGPYSSTYGNVDAWALGSSGAVSNYLIKELNLVRPVFYLSSEVKIKDGGTGEKTNPYILAL